MSNQAQDAKRQARNSLIVGHEMVCPRCKKSRDILDYQRLEEAEEFAQETAPIYKCPRQNGRGGCGWLFAPAEHTILRSLTGQPVLVQNGASVE